MDDSQESPGADDARAGDLTVTLAYFVPPLTAVIVLLMAEDDDDFARFHGWQATIWGLIQGAVAVPTLGLGVLVLYPVSLFLLYKTYKGETYELPVIGDFARGQV